jgi:hypothetical protein
VSKVIDILLMFGCEDERTRRLAKRVYRRLPACDRHVLRELIMDFTDRGGREGNLGSAGAIDPNSMVSNPGDAVMDFSYIVNLSGVKKTKSDAAAMGLIAHEFAHVVLRHSMMSVVVEILDGSEVYPDDAYDALSEWHEDDANLQAWAWGFREELAALFEEYPDSRRPRWYVKLEWGGAE